ncbi:farnesyl pyrophosphate synthase [Glomus cerebriforme]|uniref:Farnesyl pyrophosphate synthase n=1 Tax=Glomus cerebriforme TaxID=658196 RepID=A0A397SCV4_9GLOM|nr:farnesyl pyrophosphate synthase [Glomus cerebriforme]
MSSQESKAQAVKDFTEVFPVLTEEFLKEVRIRNFPEESVKWIEKNIYHNVQGGKMNRGLSVVDTLKILKNDQLTAEELLKSRVLGWCIEWLQAFFLVADDIMDSSITRRGNPCWYKMEGVGMIAINDAFILESAIYFFLKKYFRQDPYYIDLVELFHEITLETELGQLLDLTTAPEDHVDLSKFSIEKHQFIVLYKTAFYSFYLPVALAMHMAGIKDEKAFKAAKDILLPLGEYFQIQDDYLDCYGDPKVIGKIGTDIEDNKCSWLINQALAKASPEQRKLLDENYGKKDPKNVAVIKQIYKDLEIEKLYKEYEEQSYIRLNDLILQTDDSLIKRQVFNAFMNKIYKRTK